MMDNHWAQCALGNDGHPDLPITENQFYFMNKLAHEKVQEEYSNFGKLVDEELAKGNFMTLNTLLGYIESDFTKKG